MGFAICGKSPSLQTFVYSAPVPPAVFTIRAIFATIAPVPDGWTAVGSGFDGGQYAQYYCNRRVDVRRQPGRYDPVVSGQQRHVPFPNLFMRRPL